MDNSKKRGFVRRRMLQGAGGVFIAAAALPSAPLTAAQSANAPARAATADITGRLARYMVEPRTRALPPIVLACKHRILDTFAAMVSGAHLKPGEMAIATPQPGRRRGSDRRRPTSRTTAVNAALANAMFGHADETDDFEPVDESASRAAPSCPRRSRWRSAKAARAWSCSGRSRSATTCAAASCWRSAPDHVRGTHRSAEGTSSTFGARRRRGARSRSSTKRRCATRCRTPRSRSRDSGAGSRDAEHVEKAFDFSGMGARNGVTAAIMVADGLQRRVGRVRRRAQRARGALDRAESGGDGGRPRQPLLRDRDGDQAVLRRLSHPGAARCVPQARREHGLSAEQREEHRRAAAGGRRARREQPRRCRT